MLHLRHCVWARQLDVYNLTARPIIDSVLEGYNGKLVYGNNDI